jgi:hypothetical protein
MNDFTMAELGVFIGVVGGVCTSLILTFQKSKCETIKCCGCEIKRYVKEKGQADPLGAKVPYSPSPEPEPEPEPESKP